MPETLLKGFAEDVRQGVELSAGDVSLVAAALVDGTVGEEAKAEFLGALSERGETAGEIAAFAAVFRGYAKDPGLSEWSGRAVDVCGTGGDHSGTFNVSTAMALVVASQGVPVIKHGNRSITSKSGSADLLTALGIRLELTTEEHRRVLAAANFTFLFAPGFHPAFKHIAPVRKRLASEGRRSIFNLLGPLLNPARPAYQLLGVPRLELVAPMSHALGELGLAAALVVNGSSETGAGIDEATVCGPSLIRGSGRLRSVNTVWEAADFGLPAAPLSALAGGGPEENARMLAELFRGCLPGALEDTVVLNAALALWCCERVSHPREGVELARRAIRDGAALRTLENVRELAR
jgi:anthranilate phosphoribosyltransferase